MILQGLYGGSLGVKQENLRYQQVLKRLLVKKVRKFLACPHFEAFL
jgi:hypothetical protein